MQRYMQSFPVGEVLRTTAVEAKRDYLRVGIGGDMQFVLSDFMRPLPVGSVKNGERLLLSFLNKFIRSVPVLSYSDALTFVSETQSSPGWPLTEQGYPTRAAAIDAGVATTLAEQFENSGLHSIWTGCLKEEVLKRSKFETGHTRFFACCPLHAQLVILRYSAVFNQAVINWSAEEVFPFYVGRSPIMGGWHRLCTELNHFGGVFSLDERLWDTTLSLDLFRALYRVRNSLFATPLSSEKLDWLVEELVCTYIVTDTGEVVRKYQGNASGSPNTLIDNSLILLMLYMEAFTRVYPDASDVEFFKAVRLNIIGDDNIASISPAWPLFTKDVVMDVMREWGISPRVESVTDTIVGAHYVAKDVGVFKHAGLEYFVPLPGRKRLLAHYLYSTPGDNVLLSAIKCNSLLLEVAFDDELWNMLYTFQSWYLVAKGNMYRWCTSDLSIDQFLAGIVPRAAVIRAYLGLESLSLPCINSSATEMPKKQKQHTQQGKKPAKQKLMTVKPVAVAQQVVRSNILTPSHIAHKELALSHTLSDGDEVGTIFLDIPISANSTTTSKGSMDWFKSVANLFRSYTMHKVLLRVMMPNPTTTGGSVVFWIEQDPTVDLSILTRDQVIARAMQTNGARTVTLHDTFSWNIPLKSRAHGKFMTNAASNDSARLEVAGRIMGAVASVPTSASKIFLEVDWSATFFDPINAIAPASATCAFSANLLNISGQTLNRVKNFVEDALLSGAANVTPIVMRSILKSISRALGGVSTTSMFQRPALAATNGYKTASAVSTSLIDPGYWKVMLGFECDVMAPVEFTAPPGDNISYFMPFVDWTTLNASEDVHFDLGTSYINYANFQLMDSATDIWRVNAGTRMVVSTTAYLVIPERTTVHWYLVDQNGVCDFQNIPIRNYTPMISVEKLAALSPAHNNLYPHKFPVCGIPYSSEVALAAVEVEEKASECKSVSPFQVSRPTSTTTSTRSGR